jgi:hypothetical protein
MLIQINAAASKRATPRLRLVQLTAPEPTVAAITKRLSTIAFLTVWTTAGATVAGSVFGPSAMAIRRLVTGGDTRMFDGIGGGATDHRALPYRSHDGRRWTAIALQHSHRFSG